MNVKNINNILGNLYYVLAISKFAMIFLIITKGISNVNTVFSGGVADGNYYEILSTIIAFFELIIILISFIMIFVNAKQEDGVIKGYLFGISAFILENVLPNLILLYVLFAIIGLYIKAGSEIKRKNIGGVTSSYNYKKVKEIKKNTDWFFNDDK